MKESLKTAQAEAARAAALTGPIVERSINEALDAAREKLKAVDFGKAAMMEARRAIRQSSKYWALSDEFGNERVFGADPSIDRQSKSFPVSGVAKVNITTSGCSVRIVGTDESVVRYSVTKIRSAGDSSPIDVTDKAGPRSVEINVSSNPEEKWRTRLEVFVPRKTDLKVTTDGELRIDGVSGKLELKGEDESIILRGASGDLTVASSSGRIRTIGFQGAASVETELGTVDLDGDFDQLTARSDLGDILVTVPASFAGEVRSTESDDIRFDGISPVRVGGDDGPLVYKIGQGGRKLSLDTDGSVVVRSSDSLLSRN